jgi:hypothetical protein
MKLGSCGMKAGPPHARNASAAGTDTEAENDSEPRGCAMSSVDSLTHKYLSDILTASMVAGCTWLSEDVRVCKDDALCGKNCRRA